MSTPPAPPQAELLDRPFSFYPAIQGVENNEWRLKLATWSELLVRNTQADLELAIPRQYFGPVTETDKPVMIVGLNHELEYKMGAVWPVKKKVLSMPAPPMKVPPGMRHEDDPGAPKGLSAMMGVSSEGTDSRMTRLIGMSFLGLLGVVFAIWLAIKFTPVAKPTFVAKDQQYLELTRDDDYFAIVRKLGKPGGDHVKPNSGELHYRALFYQERGYAVILMGGKAEEVRYIGAMGLGPDGQAWAPLHSIEFARGANTMGILRGLKRF